MKLKDLYPLHRDITNLKKRICSEEVEDLMSDISYRINDIDEIYIFVRDKHDLDVTDIDISYNKILKKVKKLEEIISEEIFNKQNRKR